MTAWCPLSLVVLLLSALGSAGPVEAQLHVDIAGGAVPVTGPAAEPRLRAAGVDTGDDTERGGVEQRTTLSGVRPSSCRRFRLL
jgi:hypothetical protein